MSYGWLDMHGECFMPGPPLVAVWEKAEYPIPCVESACVVNKGKLSPLVSSQFRQSLQLGSHIHLEVGLNSETWVDGPIRIY